MDNWRNEDLCRWMEVALIPQHISDEMYVRKGVCVNDSEVIELTTQATYASKYVAVVPSSKPSRK